jgi:hypothetical protein
LVVVVVVVVGWRNLGPTSHLPGAGGCTVKEKKESKLWYQLLHVSREIDHPPAANHWKEYNILHTQLPQWISRDSQSFLNIHSQREF